jgi:hypothetical protein
MWKLRLSAGNNAIADFQLPISDWPLGMVLGLLNSECCRIEDLKSAIGNWQSEINK